jgi:hypothetical protein
LHSVLSLALFIALMAAIKMTVSFQCCVGHAMAATE